MILPFLLLLTSCSPIKLTIPKKVSTVNSMETLIADISLPHDARPHGVPETVDWADAPRIGMGNDAGEFRAMTAWGQVYTAAAGSPAVNTRVQIRSIEAYYLSKSDAQWHKWQDSLLVEGAFYREDFAEDLNIPADLRVEADGGISVKLTAGYNYHFWPDTGRVQIDPSDIDGVFTSVQARLVMDDPDKPDDRKQANLLLSMGGDYWLSLNAVWDYWTTNGDIAIGRFKTITPAWQAFNMSTLSEATLRKNPPPFR